MMSKLFALIDILLPLECSKYIMPFKDLKYFHISFPLILALVAIVAVEQLKRPRPGYLAAVARPLLNFVIKVAAFWVNAYFNCKHLQSDKSLNTTLTDRWQRCGLFILAQTLCKCCIIRPASC